MEETVRKYKVLKGYLWGQGNYSLIPIRDSDKYVILEMRNQQIDVLRQREPLTIEKQETYFKNTVDSLFKEDKPAQLLFSFLLDGVFIGYGGLVHINWAEKNAEISFLTLTERNVDEKTFVADFSSYLIILKRIAFGALGFTKLHTTFYDIEERVLYKQVLVDFGFTLEKKLPGYISVRGKKRDAFIYSIDKTTGWN